MAGPNPANFNTSQTMSHSTSDYFPSFRKAATMLRAIAAFCLPRFTDFLHRLRLLFLSLTSLKCYLILTTLTVLVYTGLRWVGRHALKTEQERVAAMGMAIDTEKPAISIIPESENFFTAPVFQGQFSSQELKMWLSKRFLRVKTSNGGVEYRDLRDRKNTTLAEWCESLKWIGTLPSHSTQDSAAQQLVADRRWDPIIDAVYAASERPLASLPAKVAGKNSFEVIPAMFASLSLHARANLAVGNASKAAPFFRANQLRIRAYALEPSSPAFSQATRSLHSQKSLLLEGIASHQWEESVLRDLVDANYPVLIESISRRAIEADRLNIVSYLSHAQYPPHLYVERGSWSGKFWKAITPDYYLTSLAVNCSQSFAALWNAARPLGRNEEWNSRVAELQTISIPNRLMGEDSPTQMLTLGHVARLIPAALQHLSAMLELHYLSHNSYPPALEQLNPPPPRNLLLDIGGQKISYTTNPQRTTFTLVPVHLQSLTPPNLFDQNELVYSTNPVSHVDTKN